MDIVSSGSFSIGACRITLVWEVRCLRVGTRRKWASSRIEYSQSRRRYALHIESARSADQSSRCSYHNFAALAHQHHDADDEPAHAEADENGRDHGLDGVRDHG